MRDGQTGGLARDDATSSDRVGSRPPEGVDLAHRLALVDLAGGIAHEVKNQLTVVTASIQLARGSANLSVSGEYLLGRAWAAAMRAASLVDDMLVYAQGSAGDRGEGADVSEAVESAVAELWDAFAGLDVRLEMQTTAMPRVAVGGAALRVLVAHMLRLAAEAVRPGTSVVVDAVRDGETVRVRLRSPEAPQGRAAHPEAAAGHHAGEPSAWEVTVNLAREVGATLERDMGWPALVLPIRTSA